MKAHEVINEIHRLNVSDREFTHEFEHLPRDTKWKPLPGGSGLKWAMSKSYDRFYIWIAGSASSDFVPPKRDSWVHPAEYKNRVQRAREQWESGIQVIGELVIKKDNNYHFLTNAYSVSMIYVDPKARKQGVAKSLYGIVLYTLGLVLVSGDQQTAGGRRNWLSLSQIPGVEVKGIVVVDDGDLGPVSAAHASRYLAKDKLAADAIIDTIMTMGGDYLGANKHKDHCFAFDVVPSTGELAPAIATQLNRIYVKHTGASPDLFARWVG